MTPITTAMVMAAGYGTRMRPLTDHMSKAMVTVGGRPLIDHMLTRLERAGVRRIIVNVHAHADHLEAYLKARKSVASILISDERDMLLETGGGVAKALPLLGTSPVFLCNIDAIWIEFEPVFDTLNAAWDPQAMDELLLCARQGWAMDKPGTGDFNIGKDARLTLHKSPKATHLYAGVEVFKPELMAGYDPVPFRRNDIWAKSLKRRRMFGMELAGYWMHVGNPRARRAAEAILNAPHAADIPAADIPAADIPASVTYTPPAQVTP